MSAPRFVALCGPRRQEGRDRAFESVVKEAKAATDGKLLVVNLDAGARWPAAPIKTARAGLTRYVRNALFGDIPFVGHDEARSVFSELLKRDAADSLDGRIVLALADEAQIGSLCGILDALAFFVPGDSRSVPWLFPIVKDISARRGCPCCITVLDERRIEKAAEFFLSMKAELGSLAKKDLDIAFNACIAFDPEKTSLCAANGLSYTDFFSGEDAHGQAKVVAKGILAMTAGQEGSPASDALRVFIDASASAR